MSKILSLVFVLSFLGMLNAYGIVNLNCGTQFTDTALKAHNGYRKNHGAQSVINNSTIIAIAQNYSSYLASNLIFQHSQVVGLGENLAYIGSTTLYNCSYYAQKFVDNWYSEIKYYNFLNPSFSSATGHFTQVVWNSSTQIGCGLTVNFQKKFIGTLYYDMYLAYGVCNYYPPGNYLGQFQANVFPKLA